MLRNRNCAEKKCQRKQDKRSATQTNNINIADILQEAKQNQEYKSYYIYKRAVKDECKPESGTNIMVDLDNERQNNFYPRDHNNAHNSYF